MHILDITPQRIGLGTYRMSIRSKEHQHALTSALKSGCQIIDTAANYTNGESEELIGEILSKNPNFTPLIITKAGYIQGRIVENLQSAELFDAIEKCSISESNFVSIDPKFLQFQIQQSQKALNVDKLDLFMLHNPEYFLKHQFCTKDEYYKKIESALLHLEKEVNNNNIISYGISSNTFILPLDHPESTDFGRIIEIIQKHNLQHFDAIQFPFNFLEIGAMEQFWGGLSILQLAKEENIRTISNRPLNAFTDQGLLRIAEYDKHCPPLSTQDAKKHFDIAMEIIEKKYFDRLKEEEDGALEETIWDIPFFDQFKKIWCTLLTPDAVEQVYYENFFPLLAQIWGGEGVPPEESEPFFALFDISVNFARQNMHTKGQIFKKQAMNAGLIEPGDQRDLAIIACTSYLEMGVDFVLVGAKRSTYVDQLKSLF